MKYIKKTTEPSDFTRYKCNPIGTSYSDIDSDVKKILKKSLLEEQGFLCCYCMKRIDESSMRVEHFQCQDNYKKLALSYRNMLASCSGKIGLEKTCDACKGNKDITINPLIQTYIDKLEFRYDGEILSKDSDISRDLNETLNLNVPQLKRNREAFIQSMLERLNKNKSWTKSEIQKIINKLEQRNMKSQYMPYCDAAIYIFKKRLRRCP